MTEMAQTAASLPLDIQRQLPKHVRLKLALREKLKELQSGATLPSISSLQAEFGVGLATVTRALRDLQADGLVEARHGIGVFATGRVHLKSVAIYIDFNVMGQHAGIFPQLLLKGFEVAARRFTDIQYRHYLSAGPGVDWSRRICVLQDDVRRHLVDGVIMLGRYDGQLSDLPVPVVALNAPPGVTCRVDLDFEVMIRRALATLKARNCRRVVLLGPAHAALPPPEDPYYKTALLERQRREFFRAEAPRQGMATRDEWVCGAASGGDLELTVRSAARTFTAAWQAAPEKPNALICLDDYMTTGAIQAMRELGIEPGRDIQIVSHANRGSNVLADLPVTAIEFDPTDVAQSLLETVHKLIDGVNVPDTVLVPPVGGTGA